MLHTESGGRFIRNESGRIPEAPRKNFPAFNLGNIGYNVSRVQISVT
jgi:hypothetical protein